MKSESQQRAADAAAAAVLRAAAACRLVQRDLARVSAVAKDDRSPVTVADFASQAIVAATLRDALCDVRLVAEETSGMLRTTEGGPMLDLITSVVRSTWAGATPAEILDAIDVGASEPDASGFWTLDPVDGTKGFLRGGQYAIALAYIENSAPVLGVLGCPNMPFDPSVTPERIDARGAMFTSVAGEGAWGGECGEGSPRRRIRREAGDSRAPLRLCGSVEAAHTNAEAADTIAVEVDPRFSVVRFDSQCKYGAVANGQADAYLRLPVKRAYVERIWDHAAGALIAAEAGCVVSDVIGKRLDFGRGRGLEANTGVVCATGAFHGALVERTARLAR